MSKILILFLLFVSTFAHAQILNVEKRRGTQSKDGWAGNIDFSGKYTKNTKEVYQFSNKALIQYKQGLKNYLILSDLKIIKKNQEDLINKGAIHLRYIKQIKDSVDISYEVFVQTQFNAVQKINQRSLLGGDFRFKIVGNDTINFNLGTGAMLEYEVSTLDTYATAIRFTNYVSFNWIISQAWKFKLITYYQPKVNEISDYRLSNESSLSYQISKQFSIVGVFNGLFDSSPIEGIPNQIYTGSLLFRYVLN